MTLTFQHVVPRFALVLSSALLLTSVSTGCKTASGDRGADEAASEVVEQPAQPRAVEMRFVVTDDVAADLDAPAAGELRGAIFRTEDVGAFGPKKGAEPIAKMDPRAVDLSGDEPTRWTTPELAPGEYTFLGFVDLDENSPDGPDDGDIVTRPGTNRFRPEQVDGPLEVRFDYIKGSTIFG